jgi:hypothetical protein
MLPDLEPFLPRVRALFPDTRGHGLSQKFERAEDYTYPKKCLDLLDWLDGLGVAQAIWGGASMGGAPAPVDVDAIPLARCGRPVLSHTVCGRAGSAPALDACPLLTREACRALVDTPRLL